MLLSSFLSRFFSICLASSTSLLLLTASPISSLNSPFSLELFSLADCNFFFRSSVSLLYSLSLSSFSRRFL